jgi:hypothetical protein
LNIILDLFKDAFNNSFRLYMIEYLGDDEWEKI